MQRIRVLLSDLPMKDSTTNRLDVQKDEERETVKDVSKNH